MCTLSSNCASNIVELHEIWYYLIFDVVSQIIFQKKYETQLNLICRYALNNSYSAYINFIFYYYVKLNVNST